MKRRLEDMQVRIRALQDDVEAIYREARFVTQGDAAHHHQELNRLRKDYEDLRAQLKKTLPAQTLPSNS